MLNELYSKLHKNTINRNNLDSLINEFNADKFIVFIGAGINNAIKGVSDWEGLYCELHKEYFSKEPASSEGALYYPSKFSELYYKIEKGKRSSFDCKIFEKTKPHNTSGSMVYMAIVQAFNCYVTTNYNDSIEAAFRYEHKGKVNLSKYYFEFPSVRNKPNENTLTYLHGCEDIGFCIIREADYKYYYPSLYNEKNGVFVLENSWRNILTRHNVVFLGTSIEEDIKKYISYLKASPKTDTNKELKCHYWITHESCLSKNRNENNNDDKQTREQKEIINRFYSEYDGLNIKPILYAGIPPDEHDYIEKLCNYLTALRANKKVMLMKDEDRSTI